MKVIIKYFLPVCLLICLTGCEEQNYLHQKYLDEGETFYPGMPNAVKDSAGNERVKFTWTLGADPRVVKSVFYWNDGDKDDSQEISVTRTQTGELNMEVVLNVKEGTHDFMLVNEDSDKHKSLAVTRTVQIYGPKYISRLANRKLSSSSFDGGKLTINWSIVESALIQYSTVYYTDYSSPGNPVAKSIRVENADTQTVIEGVREGDTYSVSTTYLPVGGLDELESQKRDYTVE
jgi:hypothetical protein